MRPSPAAVAPGTAILLPRTRLLLEGPVAATLLRLAAPNVLVMVLQAAVSTMDAVFVGWLGSDALAGVALVFPLVMLMQTMSAGGMGGGVASAVARALGAGRRADANALVAHACVIALVMAGCFTLLLELGGPALYRAMGGHEAVLDSAVAYSRVLFGGAIAYWLLNTLGAVIRGTGNMALPASVMVASGRAAQAGVLFRDAEAIETLRKVDTLIVDKTGTLTEGRPVFSGVQALAPFDEEAVLRLAASLDAGSEHPLAQAVVQEARRRGLTLSPAQDFESGSGIGVTSFGTW